MKLEVGMYVRGFRGINKIIKIEPYNDTFLYYTDGKEGKPFYFERHIKRPSFNPIDLIEVGDYVNGVEVMEVDLEEKPYLKFVHGISTTDVGLITYMGDSKLYGIKSIVTKEQFKANEYVVE